MSRIVILHYHFYKNAGTSLDTAFQTAFPGKWANLEPKAPRGQRERLLVGINAHPDIIVFSSHTAIGPVPQVEGLQILPVIFLRHPLDRARSIYDYARKAAAVYRSQGRPLSESAAHAESNNMADYLAWRLARNNVMADFQTHRMAHFAGRKGPGAAQEALADAPFIGVVEAFDASVKLLNTWLEPHFPGISLQPEKKNITTAGITLEQRLETMRTEIGEPMWRRMRAANMNDLALWHAARRKLREACAMTKGAA